jgi:NodT family efflux transporter outer membrane factor (OMF) lipoprotein
MYTVGLALSSWEIDFFGRIASLSQAALAQYLATEEGRKAAQISLVSSVANTWLSLVADQELLAVARETLQTREESLRLTKLRFDNGVASELDFRLAQSLAESARVALAQGQRQLALDANALSLLIGQPATPDVAGNVAIANLALPDVPAGLPSEVLVRRPDVQQAEQQLVAANAQIGVARSAYFPQIPLTGSGGFESTALSSLFAGASAIWTAAATATEPVFTAGRTRSQVAAATARREEAVISYQHAIRQAFREVSDALVGYRKLRDFREQQALLFGSAGDARRLSEIRYEGGAASYLEVLDADTRMFDAELGLAQAELSELSALVEIYRALGGGWQG